VPSPPSSPSPPAGTIGAVADVRPNADIIAGTGIFAAQNQVPARPPAASNGGNGITLNFVNADVRDVAKAVLGDYLKLNYAVAPNVQGMLTIETSAPLARADVLALFEQSLRLSQLALVSNNGIYRIVPIADAAKEASLVTAGAVPGGQAGFGVQIVPLKFVGAAEISRLLAILAPAQGSVQVDPTRNLLIIAGSAQERAQLTETINLFDVDWLAGTSFALYTPQYMSAQELVRELGQVIGGANSPIASLVRLIPIDRLNTVLAVSPQVQYLQELQQWVTRLDRPGQGSDRRIFIYRVQNGRASDLASVLIRALSGNRGGGRGQADVFGADIAPPANGVPGPGAGVAPPQVLGAVGANVSAIGDINITADERNNALVIVASPQEYGAVEAALRQLDTEPLQVLLEAAIAEVTLTDDLRYGVQYFARPGGDHQIALSTSNTSAIAPTFPGFSYAFTQGSNIKVVLDALSSVTNVEVISAPELLVLNNQPATLQVGDQVPIVTQQAISTITTGAPLVNSVQYHDTGVILKVTPRVNQGGMVMMDISQEVSDVATTTTSSIDSPTIKQRKIESIVAVRDNETIALGGLIMDNATRGRNGIPLLSDIPVVGGLFGTTSTRGTRTELMVLITPHVVDSLSSARAVTDELRRKLPALQPIFERAQIK
jgi:general secretion pathway protein D